MTGVFIRRADEDTHIYIYRGKKGGAHSRQIVIYAPRRCSGDIESVGALISDF